MDVGKIVKNIMGAMHFYGLGVTVAQSTLITAYPGFVLNTTKQLVMQAPDLPGQLSFVFPKGDH